MKVKLEFLNNKKTRIYFIFGIKKTDIEEVKQDLEKLLNISFEAHDSSYLEEYYVYKNNNNANIKIVGNFVDEDWQEENHKDCPFLLYLNRFTDSEELFKIITTNLAYIVPIKKSIFFDDSTYSKYVYENWEFKLIKKGKTFNWKKKK